MTIGIGVLCTDKIQPDHVVLMADTMGSYDDAYSSDGLNKMFCAPEAKLYGIGANSVEEAGSQFEVIYREIMKSGSLYSDRRHAIKNGVSWYMRHHFCMEGPHGYPPNGLDQAFEESNLSGEALAAWKSYSIGCELLLASIDDANRASLFYLNGSGGVEPIVQCSHGSIGSGADNSSFWLGYRNVTMGMTVRQAAYCAFEAKTMASKSPKVNDHLAMVIANSVGFSYQLNNTQTDGALKAPITLNELREMFKTYGPQDIQSLR